MAAKTKVARYSDWTTRKVRVADLFLDQHNIRLNSDGLLSLDALINDLIVNENGIELVKSIASNGMFPTELPVAVMEGEKLVVLDGNRRIAALKTLLNPKIVPSKEAVVRRLAKEQDSVIRQTNVSIAPSREAAKQLLANTHTKNLRRRWSTLRQAYFYKAELKRGKTVADLKKQYPEVDIIKFLKMLDMHAIAKGIDYDSDEIAKKVHDQRNFNITTLERLYDDKQVRDFLGFDFQSDGKARITIARDEFEKGYKQIIQDIVNKAVDSRFLNNEENRRDYLATIPTHSVPRLSKASAPMTSKAFKEKPIAISKSQKKLYTAGIQFGLHSRGVFHMYDELKRIDVKSFPNATHDLLRSFLECSIKAYFEQTKVKVQRKGRFAMLDDVLKEIEREFKNRGNHTLAGVMSKIISTEKWHGYAANVMNATNHNHETFVSPDEVFHAWDTMFSLFQYILNPSTDQTA